MADKTWIIYGILGLAVAGGLIYYFVTKEEPAPPPGDVSAQINSFTISA